MPCDSSIEVSVDIVAPSSGNICSVIVPVLADKISVWMLKKLSNCSKDCSFFLKAVASIDLLGREEGDAEAHRRRNCKSDAVNLPSMCFNICDQSKLSFICL